MRRLFACLVILTACGGGDDADVLSPRGVWSTTLVDGTQSTTYTMCIQAFGSELTGRALVDSGHVVRPYELVGSAQPPEFEVFVGDFAIPDEVFHWEGVMESADAATGQMDLAGHAPFLTWPWGRVANDPVRDCQ